MGIYARHVLPRLIDLVMRTKAGTAERARLVPLARGRVLEVGFGSGLNLPFYGRAVDRLYAVDPSWELWRLATRRLTTVSPRVDFVLASAERIPLPGSSVDDVVMTWTACSIRDVALALSELHRVLTPQGRLLFVEHGRSPEPRVRAWQERMNPLWRRLAGGCNLNRKIDELLVGAGFRLAAIECGYNPGPRPLAYLYKGIAEKGG